MIDATGENRGVLPSEEALRLAAEAGLDLVEISPTVSPPVCKILDYGRFKYEEQKRQSQARARQKTTTTKEIKMRPNTDTHDYEVKMRKVDEILASGDKVRLVIRFRGREMTHPELGRDLLQKILKRLEGAIRVEQQSRMEGRQMVAIIAPKLIGIAQNADPETGVGNGADTSTGKPAADAGKPAT